MKQWKVVALCSLFGVVGYGAAYWVGYSRCVTTSREIRASVKVDDYTESVQAECRRWTTESIGWRP